MTLTQVFVDDDRGLPNNLHPVAVKTIGSQEYQVFLQADSSGNIIAPGSGLVPGEYDYIALTYVAAGNGAGEIETATYKTGGASGTAVATLTLTYDANDKLATVTKA